MASVIREGGMPGMIAKAMKGEKGMKGGKGKWQEKFGKDKGKGKAC